MLPALEIACDHYRSSRQGEDEAFQERFSASSHRALMWRIEQRILKALLHKQFPRPDQVRLLELDVASATG